MAVKLHKTQILFFYALQLISAEPQPVMDFHFHSHYFQGWADFGSFSSLEPPSVNGGGPESEQRSTSPVAMDTADSTSNRTQAYCT